MSQTLNKRESKRKLASIQEVKEIHPIKDADRIEVAVINGWEVVVKKNTFKVGDKGVFFEIDSFLPLTKPFDFLKGTEKENIFMDKVGYKIRTAKLRQTISQGLFLETGVFEELKGKEFNIGDDVTELLGVEKYYVPEVATALGETAGEYPTQFISKSDEERLQSNLELGEKLKGKDYYETVKYDGTSISIIKYFDELYVCARNNQLKEKDSVVWKKLAFEINSIRNSSYDKLYVQGEFYGEGIQKNKLGIQNKQWAVFTIHEGKKRKGLIGMLTIAKELDLEVVEIVEVGTTSKEKRDKLIELGIDKNIIKNTGFNYTLEELLKQAEGKYKGTNNDREGIVIRTLEDMWRNESISFKVLNNKFLLKEKD